MPSDLKKPQVGSMSTEQLAEKLEKSEAGRKKLRQAISILQEKLAATDKVLKVNETLRQECDLERQHAAEEKKKAEEEKRLRCILENDNAAFKEQLIKISKRLGVVENKQKSDKKEVDRLRAEVSLSCTYNILKWNNMLSGLCRARSLCTIKMGIYSVNYIHPVLAL